MVAKGDAGKLIWTTEYGQPTPEGTEAQQAAFLRDMLSTWRTFDYVGPAFVYTTRDKLTGSTDLADTFGVLHTNWSDKLAAQVIRDLTGAGVPLSAAYELAASPEFWEQVTAPDTAFADPSERRAAVGAMSAAGSVLFGGLKAATALVASLTTLNPLAVVATTFSAASYMTGTALAAVEAVSTPVRASKNPGAAEVALAFARIRDEGVPLDPGPTQQLSNAEYRQNGSEPLNANVDNDLDANGLNNDDILNELENPDDADPNNVDGVVNADIQDAAQALNNEDLLDRGNAIDLSVNVQVAAGTNQNHETHEELTPTGTDAELANLSATVVNDDPPAGPGQQPVTAPTETDD
jgi:hypothetical protein